MTAGLSLAALPASAQAPAILSHQGKLTVNGTNFTGIAQFKFALVNASGNATLWSDNGTSAGGAAPSDPPIALAVNRGIFSVNLGDLTVSNMTLAVSASVFTNTGVFLRTWVNDGVDGWQQLSPDVQIVSVGYALSAVNLTGNVSDAQLSANMARINGTNAFTGTNSFAGVTVATNASNVFNGTFAGNLSGNATTAASAVQAATATTANAFSGSLSGDVTGTQGATVVASVGGQTAAAVAGGARAANGATSANTANTIVQRDASGNFSASTITAANLNGSFNGNGSGLTGLNPASLSAGTAAINISGNAATAATATNLSGNVSDAQLSANMARLNGTNAFTGTNHFAGVTVATNASNVFDGTFAGNLSGNAATATTANAFSGSLSGDVTGTQGATVVASVGGQTAAAVASGARAANGATGANTANAIVQRDASGNFSASTITAASLYGSFIGDGSGLTGLNPGNLSAGTAAINISGNAATAATAMDLTGNVSDAQLSANMARLNGTNAFTGTNDFAGVTVATNANNVFNGTFAGNLSGNAATATTANAFSGSLSGDVTGTQGATVVASVGGQTAAAVASGARAANGATGANIANTIVQRDVSVIFQLRPSRRPAYMALSSATDQV